MLKNNLEYYPYTSNKRMPTGKALIFAPHPDDEVLGCGGAIIRHVQQNDAVKIVIITDGAYPLVDEQKKPEYKEARMIESTKAAHILGYEKPVFLNFPDNFLKLNKKLLSSLKKEIESFKPDNIYIPHSKENHPDHRIINKAVLKVVKRLWNCSAKHILFYEISNPLKPNYLHDITDISSKLNLAMSCFKSQLAVNDYLGKIMALNEYRTYTLSQEVKYAEAYDIKEIKYLFYEKCLNIIASSKIKK